MKDIFDGHFRDELSELYCSEVWSNLSAELKERMVDKVKNSLSMNSVVVSEFLPAMALL